MHTGYAACTICDVTNVRLVKVTLLCITNKIIIRPQVHTLVLANGSLCVHCDSSSECVPLNSVTAWNVGMQ